MDFYDRVKEITKQKNISLINLLQSLGINYETYKSAKRLGHLPRADEALLIAKSLDTSVEFLVTGEDLDNDVRLNDAKRKIIDFIQSLD